MSAVNDRFRDPYMQPTSRPGRRRAATTNVTALLDDDAVDLRVTTGLDDVDRLELCVAVDAGPALVAAFDDIAARISVGALRIGAGAGIEAAGVRTAIIALPDDLARWVAGQIPSDASRVLQVVELGGDGVGTLGAEWWRPDADAD